ncbi:MAG: hydroxymethylbilane synthase [Aquificae bacterium]|nr:hydroxymethylbilane synthase [Aquificota bacterium]
MKIRIGTRKSKLALWQANYVADILRKHGYQVELIKITTKGDKILDVPLAKVGGKGLFVKEIEEALLRGEIDIAVHSLKDVPTYFPEGLGIIAVSDREDPRDAFLSVKYEDVYSMDENSVIGTSSLRRKAQLKILAPKVQTKDLRGNVDTRIKKLEQGEYDGILLAYAGLKRLGFEKRVKKVFSPQEMIPAVCQGFLGIEGRLDDKRIIDAVSILNSKDSQIRATAERSFLATLEGGCQVPIAAYSEIKDGEIELIGFVSDLEGNRVFKDKISGSLKEAKMLGVSLAERLLEQGAKKVLEEIYGENQ